MLNDRVNRALKEVENMNFFAVRRLVCFANSPSTCALYLGVRADISAIPVSIRYSMPTGRLWRQRLAMAYVSTTRVPEIR